MKTFLLAMLAAGLLVAAGGEVPRKAPPLAIHTTNQKTIPLTQYSGKTIVLAFVLSNCNDCQALTKVLNGIQKDYVARGVQVIESVLDTNDPGRIELFQKSLGTVFPVGYNTADEGVQFMKYPPREQVLMPVVIFIDRYGTIRAQLDGQSPAMKDMDKNLRFTLEQGLNPGAAPSGPPAATKK